MIMKKKTSLADGNEEVDDKKKTTTNKREIDGQRP